MRMPRPTYRYLHTGYPCVLVRLKDDRPEPYNKLKGDDPGPWEPLTPSGTLRYVQIEKTLSLSCARTPSTETSRTTAQG